MSRALFAGILLLVILVLYGIQTQILKKPADKKESFVDTSGNELNFPDLFSQLLNKLFENAKFTPAKELDEKTLSIPELDSLNTRMEHQMSPMIAQGIDALRAASSAQDSSEFTPLM